MLINRYIYFTFNNFNKKMKIIEYKLIVNIFILTNIIDIEF